MNRLPISNEITQNWIFNLQICHQCTCVRTYMWDWCETSKTHLSRWALNSPNKFLASCFFYIPMLATNVWGASFGSTSFILLFLLLSLMCSDMKRHTRVNMKMAYMWRRRIDEWQKENFGDTNFHHISFNFWTQNSSSIHNTLPINWQKNKRGDGKRWKERRRCEFSFTIFLFYSELLLKIFLRRQKTSHDDALVYKWLFAVDVNTESECLVWLLGGPRLHF